MKKTITQEVDVTVCDKCGREMDLAAGRLLPMTIVQVGDVRTSVYPEYGCHVSLHAFGQPLTEDTPDICPSCWINTVNDALETLYKTPRHLHK